MDELTIDEKIKILEERRATYYRLCDEREAILKALDQKQIELDTFKAMYMEDGKLKNVTRKYVGHRPAYQAVP